MTTLQNDLREVAAKHLAKAPASVLMSILDTLADRDESPIFFEPAPRSAPARFANLDADGVGVLSSADHVAVYQYATGLTWTAAPLQGGKEFTHAEALKAAAGLDLLGHKDWRLPTIQELLSIVDYERCDPAVDTTHFKGPHGWTWSSTVAKAPAGCAWLVGLLDGYSSRGRQDLPFQALAVRAGQQLGLSV